MKLITKKAADIHGFQIAVIASGKMTKKPQPSATRSLTKLTPVEFNVKLAPNPRSREITPHKIPKINTKIAVLPSSDVRSRIMGALKESHNQMRPTPCLCPPTIEAATDERESPVLELPSLRTHFLAHCHIAVAD